MKDYQIVLEPFLTLDVLDCNIRKAIEEHAILYFSGHIDRGMEENYLKTSFRDIEVKLVIVGEDDDTYTLFCGIAKNVQIHVEGDLRKLSVEAISGSYYLDLVPYTRVFQNSTSTYDTVLKYNEGYYQNAGHAMTVGNGRTIGNLLVQYHETDWEFAKRLASHFNECLVPAYRKQGIHFYFGFPDGKTSIGLSQEAYTIKKDTGDYLKKARNNQVSLVESDALCLEVSSRDVYEIGDSFSFRGQTYYIYEITSRLNGRELLHHYKLKSKGGLRVIRQYNEQMIGASLEAAIEGVSKDTVQVVIAADGIQSNMKWFPYSTVYSSPDGTGWYCMPEQGDSVRLYMPTEKEKDGYIISAVHLPQQGEARSIPDNKSLKSKYGKEVLFTPTSLIFTNNQGMSVEILDEEGIRIISDKAIIMKSDEKIEVVSMKQSVTVTAPESIMLVQGDTSITLKEEIHMKGAQVHIE